MDLRGRGARLVTAVAAVTMLGGCGAFGTDGPVDAEGTAALPVTEPPEPPEPPEAATATPPTPPAPPAPPSGPLEVTVTATGDILTHSRVTVTAQRYAGGTGYDYTPMFAEVRPLLSAGDLTLCHLETPLSPDDTNLSVPDTLVFNTPHEMADALADAGVDGCDFASNHTMDQGLAGLEATEQVLRDAGMGYAGPTAHERRAGRAEVYPVETSSGTARVAHLAFTYTYPNSGTPTTTVPGEAPWLAEASWPVQGSEGILEQAHAAKEDGADFVVVSMHWGDEYQSMPNTVQQELAAELLASDDVDLIIGTHVHVIQPCARINGKHVIYGMGNFLSNQAPEFGLLPATQEGMVASFTLRRDEEGVVTTSMSYQPTRVDIRLAEFPTGPHVVQLVSPQNYPDTWQRTTATVDSLGGCDADPAHP
ncbi:CapA family protein [Ornithinimicrobium tianjinense]|uniref:Poly-gamma-glutamate biosynthesis protein n=1 Tax=Ornithinimicrobium tianjinense TaxID=1195761 RepID=A0A917BM42_9MICO|nr:CapA family protein [Ornithinimicrobium tianjinense]GGF49882.1 poly-gamma-glutamate biosynthesis protein [Ornithinimicrobium tianjinense]